MRCDSVVGRSIVCAVTMLMLVFFNQRVGAEESSVAHVPAPSGPYAVGTMTIRLVDASRDDPFLHNGTKRELMVRFWYPSPRSGTCVPAEYSSPNVRRYLSLLGLLGLPETEVRTNSCRNTPAISGAHPVIVASHGYTGLFTDYTFLFEDLASRGYVIASIAHTFESSVVETPDGRLLQSHLGMHFVGDSLRTDDQSIRFAMSVRVRDMAFVLAQLKELNETKGFLSGKLDLQRIGALGHSMGADTVMTSLRQQPNLRAAVLFDPVLLSAASTAGTDKPVVLASAGREEWSESECELWSRARGPRVALMFAGAEHLTPTDAVWLGDYLPALHVETGSLGRDRTIRAIREFVSSFFGAHLEGKPPGLLLNGLSTEFVDVTVTPRTGALCAQSSQPLGIASRESSSAKKGRSDR